MIDLASIEHPQFSIAALCRLFEVSRAWYYQRKDADERSGDEALLEAIEAVTLEFPKYGYRRVTEELQRREWIVNHKRVLRVMKASGLLCRTSASYKPTTTDSRHSFRRYENRLKDLEITRLDQVWVGDITFVAVRRGWVYLATLLDACSRRCVGWALSSFIDTDLSLAALRMAVEQRRPLPGLIHHTDQGVQYANARYIALLEQHGIVPSMAAVGNPYENAMAESFNKTLKYEEVYLKETYDDEQDARRQIGKFIEDVYNIRRLHSSLGYVPPVEFEQALVPSPAD